MCVATTLCILPDTDTPQLFFVLEFVYIGILALTKISILLLYLRIFPSTVSTWFRYSCFAMIGINTAYMVAFWFSILFECDPIGHVWKVWDGEHQGTCVDTQSLIYASSGCNILLDLMVFFLPFPKLVRLEVSVRRKIGVCLTFAVGLFVTACSCIRLQHLVKWGNTQNPTWDYNEIAIWSAVEGNVSVICACLPSMAGPIKKAWQKTVGSRISSSRSKKLSASKESAHRGQGMEPEYSRPPQRSAVKKTLTVSAIYDAPSSPCSTDEEHLVEKSTYEQPGYPHTYRNKWRSP